VAAADLDYPDDLQEVPDHPGFSAEGTDYPFILAPKNPNQLHVFAEDSYCQGLSEAEDLDHVGVLAENPEQPQILAEASLTAWPPFSNQQPISEGQDPVHRGVLAAGDPKHLGFGSRRPGPHGCFSIRRKLTTLVFA
jgi:hypothetical protein